MIITCMNPKGGVGKTTSSIHIARGLQLAGATVLLLDADPQGSAIAWSSFAGVSPPLRVEAINPARLEKRLSNTKESIDHTIIDSGAKLEPDNVIQALRVSDLIIIPVQPSALDLWAFTTLTEAIELRHLTAGKPVGLFLINNQTQGTALARDIGEALSGEALKTLTARLSHRVAFVEAIASGQTAFEYEPNGKAASEAQALTDELLDIINN